MVMICHLVAVIPERLEQLREMAYSDGTELADALEVEFYDRSEIRFLADKDWQAFQYLLTGNGWGGKPPLGFVMGGCAEHLCEKSLWGFGPPMRLRPDEVRQAAEALRDVDRSKLRSRFTAAKLARKKVYCYDDIVPEQEESEWARLIRRFDELVAFYQEAAQEGRAVILWIC